MFEYVNSPVEAVAVFGIMACGVYFLVSLVFPSMRRVPVTTYGLLLAFVIVFTLLFYAEQRTPDLAMRFLQMMGLL